MANIKQRLFALSILVAGLGLYLPLYKQVYKLSVQSFQAHFLTEFAEPIRPKKPCHKLKRNKVKTAKTLPSTSSQIGIAISPDGGEIYQLTNNGIQVSNQETGEQKNFKLPHKFPELSWGTDIAYDSKRDIVSLVSFGGEGYFYRFDVQKHRWLDVRSTNNIDLKSLTYDSVSDRYIAWADGNLLFISGTGELLLIDRLGDRMTGFAQLYDRGNEMPPPVEIFARGNSISLIIYAHNSVQYIWHYDLAENTLELTYQSPEKSNIYID
jgi:hypothetical protein